MRRHIPNILTCLNLTSGALAIYLVLSYTGQVYIWALALVVLAAVFDFFDGMVARLLHVSSPIGKELDSLADDISFGLLPGLTLLCFLSDNYGCIGHLRHYAAFLALLIPALSAVRLAKFNLDERQTTSFIGLPTPANALFWMSLLASLQVYFPDTRNMPAVFYLLCAGAVIMSYLLVAELPMFSLKFHSFSWNENKIRYFFLIFSLGTILATIIAGVALLAPAIIIALYLLFNIVVSLFSKK